VARWADVERTAPAFAEAVRAVFDAHRHKTVATLRKDGAPRISGNELTFAHGDVWLGMMPGSVKARDLQRDPRIAVHSATVDPEMTDGDTKLSGRVEEIHDEETIARFVGAAREKPPGPFHLFRVDIADITLTRIGDPADHLVIETWHDGRPLQRVERR